MNRKRVLILWLVLVTGACGGGSTESSISLAGSDPTLPPTTTTATTATTTTPPPTEAVTTSTVAVTTTTTSVEGVPDWVWMLDPAAFDRFVEEIEHYFASSSFEVVVDRELGIITPVDDSYALGFVNLAQGLADEDEASWRDEIEDYFDSVMDLTDGYPRLSDTWERAAPELRIRLFDAEYLETAWDAQVPPMSREIVRNIFATVVHDTPEAARVIARGESEPWGLDDDTIFEAALANTLADGDVIVEEFQVEDGTELISIYDSFYSTSFILDLEGVVDGLNDSGALVIMPVRDSATVHIIESSDAMGALDVLAVIAANWHADGPGSLSPFVYWWRDGELTELGFLIPDVGPALSGDVGEEWTSMLEGLPPG